jgi:riboflavin kinase/FMN adenylyltransferase
MRIFHDPEEVRDIQNTVITTGSFDGVHIGHKSILNRLQKLSKQIGGESILITFHPHPRKILFPETAGKNLFLINSQQEKIELLKTTGLDNLLIINFTPEFSQMSSFDFIRKILVGKLNAKKVIVGFNHHFGHNQEGGYEVLYELGKYHGFDVEEIPEQDIENETVSSTRIRKALQEGKIQRANAYLDHYYMIIGKLEKIIPASIGNAEAAYHVIIDEECKLIPPEGTYAVSIKLGINTYKALICIQNHENSGYIQNLGRYIILFPVDPFLIDQNLSVQIHFHKMIREIDQHEAFVPLIDIIKADKPFVEELIF